MGRYSFFCSVRQTSALGNQRRDFAYKYFCKDKIELASTFTETDKSGVQFDDLNEYFVKALESRDKGYFEAFIKTYEPVLQSRAEHSVSRYNLTEDDSEDIKQIFLETLWFAFLDYVIPSILFRFCSIQKRRHTINNLIISAQPKMPVPCQRKTDIMNCERLWAFITAIPNSLPMSLLKICLFLCFKRLGGIFAVIISAPLPIKFHLRISKYYHCRSVFVSIASVFSNRAPMQRLL